MAKSNKPRAYVVDGVSYNLINAEGILRIGNELKNTSSENYVDIINQAYRISTNKNVIIKSTNKKDIDKIIWRILGNTSKRTIHSKDDILNYCLQFEKDYDKTKGIVSDEERAKLTAPDIEELIKASEKQNAKVVSNLQEITNSINEHMDKIHKDNLKQIREAKESSKSAKDQAVEASVQATKSIKIAIITMVVNIVACIATIGFGIWQSVPHKNKEKQEIKNNTISELQTIEEPVVYDENIIINTDSKSPIENEENHL